MVSNSSSNTSAPAAKGGNPLPRQQTSLLASVMQIPLKKGQKVKEADPATLQSGMTETGFSTGGETPLSIELQGCLTLIFILSSPVFPSLPERWSIQRGNITVQITYWLTQAYESRSYFCQVQFKFSKAKAHCYFISKIQRGPR